MTAFIGRSLSGRTPGERGDKRSLRSMKGRERFYSQGRRPGQVLPYKGKSAGYSSGWCPRAPCRFMPDLSSRPFCYRTRGVGSLWLLPAERGWRGVGCGRDDRERLPLILSQSVCWKPLVLLLQHHQLDHVEPCLIKAKSLSKRQGPKVKSNKRIMSGPIKVESRVVSQGEFGVPRE